MYPLYICKLHWFGVPNHVLTWNDETNHVLTRNDETNHVLTRNDEASEYQTTCHDEMRHPRNYSRLEVRQKIHTIYLLEFQTTCSHEIMRHPSTKPRAPRNDETSKKLCKIENRWYVKKFSPIVPSHFNVQSTRHNVYILMFTLSIMFTRCCSGPPWTSDVQTH
jgi:hypothetical protein